MIEIKTEKARYVVTLKLWIEREGHWSPDQLAELWPELGTTYKYDRREDVYLMTHQEFEDAIEWWEEEVKSANVSPIGGEVLDHPDTVEGDEWFLDVTEIETY